MKTDEKTPPTGRHRRKRSSKFLRLVMFMLALIAGLTFLILTYVWFVAPKTANPETVAPADAVVLFAGVEDRLETALQLVDQGVAPNLVLPNGEEIDDAEGLCEERARQVFCPTIDEVSTAGEARSIARLAEEQGWSRLVGVTSVYHVHRASYLLGRCFDGQLEMVTPPGGIDLEDAAEGALQEWAGYMAAVLLRPSC